MDATIKQTKASSIATARPAWRRWVIPLAVIALFAAGILQFALIEWHHPPASQRINDGQQPTFFAFHIVPSFDFSEDFYLYLVRAKRIALRGWSDSLFYSRPNEGKNYAAPVQVALSRLALLTDGRPLVYALYMFAILAAAWMALFAAARCWLPAEVRTASLLAAVLLTVLFESLSYFVESPAATFGVWPAFRGLRMSTMSWTNPLLVAALICATSLAFDRSRSWVRIAALLVMLSLLAGTDNWAFGIAWFSTVLTAGCMVLVALVQRYRTGIWPNGAIPTIVGVLMACSGVFLLHYGLYGSMKGDMLTRSGFGAEWEDALRPAERVMRVREWFTKQALFPICTVLFAALVVPVANQRRAGRLQIQWQRNGTAASQIAFLAMLTLTATLIMYQVLKLRGMEPFLRNQLFWRLNYFLLFVFLLAVLEWWRATLTAWSASRTLSPAAAAVKANRHPGPFRGRCLQMLRSCDALRPKTWVSATAVGLAVLFFYHTYRINWFVSNVAARHFFLTADAEKLRPWLEEFERRQGRFDLATASLELNYLAAFWTNADLLLPSGFPYHSAAGNQEIHDRLMQVLRLYRATPATWIHFSRAAKGRFHEAWLTSRVESSGAGYLYHLYHRMVSLGTATAPKWSVVERELVGSSLAADAPSGAAATVSYSHPAADVPEPKVILIDDVSRAVGDPDLARYDLAFRSGKLEAWVRRDATEVKAAAGDRIAKIRPLMDDAENTRSGR